MPDELITCKLAIITTGTARAWYQSKKKTLLKASWEEWKKAIKKDFGTPLWRRRMASAFERDKFRNEYRSRSNSWLLTQRKRMEAAWSFLETSEHIDKILSLCGGELEHAVQSRINDKTSFEEFMNIFEEIVTTTSIGKLAEKPNNLRVTFSNNKESRNPFSRDATKDPRSSPSRDFKTRDYSQNKFAGSDRNNTSKLPFRNREDRQGYSRKPINAVNCDKEQYEFKDGPPSEDEKSVQESVRDDTTDEGEDFCVSNIDMSRREPEDDDTNEDPEEIGNVTHVTHGISLEALTDNIQAA
ncbi:uncharacterized protein MELLADRAFT_64382 [Melampsora larici-populina 98AG31]|uniref:Retrotransposon gag domain-containing protein n=1 Tax=Melampsora larici-populina (strain 98AG31 / pathotype 3-4-7) TaxID=747676 RepID=F4RR83_MELLP|nr:uncharacterized protein MELLADRAFT_64382 [Melampsora larici-populina 98AG31]EGG05171.1 hypothetical protein MELLADRAFT_64382 [Melampsora larici-populina 98AG31]